MGWLPRSLPHLYNPTFSQAICSARSLLHGGLLHGLHFIPEDGSDMFLQTVGQLQSQKTELFFVKNISDLT
jgi:hypothetical protein